MLRSAGVADYRPSILDTRTALKFERSSMLIDLLSTSFGRRTASFARSGRNNVAIIVAVVLLPMIGVGTFETLISPFLDNPPTNFQAFASPRRLFQASDTRTTSKSRPTRSSPGRPDMAWSPNRAMTEARFEQNGMLT